MTDQKPGRSWPLAIFLIVVVHLSGMFAIKAWRGQERIDEAKRQAERIGERLIQERQHHANRQAETTALHQAEAVHSSTSAEEALRKLQEALVTAMPDVRVEAIAEGPTPTKGMSTSVGLTILPVSIRLWVADTDVLESIRSLEDIRPRVNMTRLQVRQADHRRRGLPQSTPLAEITIQAALLFKVGAQ